MIGQFYKFVLHTRIGWFCKLQWRLLNWGNACPDVMRGRRQHISHAFVDNHCFLKACSPMLYILLLTVKILTKFTIANSIGLIKHQACFKSLMSPAGLEMRLGLNKDMHSRTTGHSECKRLWRYWKAPLWYCSASWRLLVTTSLTSDADSSQSKQNTSSASEHLSQRVRN